MQRITKQLIISVVVILLLACNRQDNASYTAEAQIIAAYNRDNTIDDYKQRAARFLIDNMDAHYTLQSEGIDSFRFGAL